MAKSKKAWRQSPPKYIEPTTEGHCPYCHKPVQSIEHHIRAKHKGEKPVRIK